MRTRADYATMSPTERIQAKAVTILKRYISESNVNSTCGGGGTNHYYTLTCGSIVIKGHDGITNATITGVLFGAQLQSSLLSYLNGSGYKNDITANMAMPFLLFIDGDNDRLGATMQAMDVDNMINTADLKDFNALTKLFAQYIIEKNR